MTSSSSSAATAGLAMLFMKARWRKSWSADESSVAGALIYFLKYYLRRHRLGVVLAPDGLLRILPRLVRIPDVAFLGWVRLGGRRIPRAPDSGCRPGPRRGSALQRQHQGRDGEKVCATISPGACVWCGSSTRACAPPSLDTSPDQCQSIGEEESLSGGEVLPGFKLALRDLFAEAEGAGKAD